MSEVGVQLGLDGQIGRPRLQSSELSCLRDGNLVLRCDDGLLVLKPRTLVTLYRIRHNEYQCAPHGRSHTSRRCTTPGVLLPIPGWQKI